MLDIVDQMIKVVAKHNLSVIITSKKIIDNMHQI